MCAMEGWPLMFSGLDLKCRAESSPKGGIWFSRGRQPAVRCPPRRLSRGAAVPRLVQHVLALVSNPGLIQECQKFFVKCLSGVMLLLVRDVSLHRLDLGRTHADGGIAVLPRKARCVCLHEP